MYTKEENMYNQTYYLFTQTTGSASLTFCHFLLVSFIHFAVLFSCSYLVKQNCNAIQYLFKRCNRDKLFISDLGATHNHFTFWRPVPLRKNNSKNRKMPFQIPILESIYISRGNFLLSTISKIYRTILWFHFYIDLIQKSKFNRELLIWILIHQHIIYSVAVQYYRININNILTYIVCLQNKQITR